MSLSITQEKFQRQTSFVMLSWKWQLPGSDISNTVVKELKFSILQTGYQQNPGKQVNYEKLQEIGSNCHKEPALTFLSKVVSAFRYHQRRYGLYTDALRFLCTYKHVISGNGHSRVSRRILPMMSISTGRKTAARSSRMNIASIHDSTRSRKAEQLFIWQALFCNSSKKLIYRTLI